LQYNNDKKDSLLCKIKYKKMNELVLVNPSQYGIEEVKANELIGNLPQIKKERDILQEQYNEIITLDIEDSSTATKARELRLKIRDNRTKGIEPWHKNTKDYFLKGGQFIDAIRKMEVTINERMEESLELIEKHQQLKEQKAKDDLKASRLLDLQEYLEFVPNGIDLGSMSEDEYGKIFNGAKLQYDAKVEFVKKQEEERIAREQAEIARRARFEVRNKELAIYWATMPAKYSNFNYTDASEEEYALMLRDAIDAKVLHEKKQEEIKQEAERLRLEAVEKEKQLAKERAKVEAERKAAQEKLEKEQAEARKLAAELQAKKDAELKAQKGKEEQELKAKKEAEKLAKAPVKEKLTRWVGSFDLPVVDVSNEATKEIIEKFEAFKKWSVQTIEKL